MYLDARKKQKFDVGGKRARFGQARVLPSDGIFN